MQYKVNEIRDKMKEALDLCKEGKEVIIERNDEKFKIYQLKERKEPEHVHEDVYTVCNDKLSIGRKLAEIMQRQYERKYVIPDPLKDVPFEELNSAERARRNFIPVYMMSHEV